jgi:hypothetical protein
MGRDGGTICQEFILEFHADYEDTRHIAPTPGIYVQAKKTRSVVDQRRRKAERKAKRAKAATSAAFPVAAAAVCPSSEQQELQQLRACVARLEQENGKLRGRVRELEDRQQEDCDGQQQHHHQQQQGPLKRLKTKGLESSIITATPQSSQLVPMDPPRPQLIRIPSIPSDLNSVQMDEDLLQSMELLKTLTPRFGLTPQINDCSKRPRSDSLADFLNGFGDFPSTPQSRRACMA